MSARTKRKRQGFEGTAGEEDHATGWKDLNVFRGRARVDKKGSTTTGSTARRIRPMLAGRMVCTKPIVHASCLQVGLQFGLQICGMAGMLVIRRSASNHAPVPGTLASVVQPQCQRIRDDLEPLFARLTLTLCSIESILTEY